jgi:integrase
MISVTWKAPRIKRYTYYRQLGLLTVSGLRIGEALSLESPDIDWNEGLLTILSSKSGKSGLVPLYKSATEVLAEFAMRRRKVFPDRRRRCVSPPRRVLAWMLAKSDVPSIVYPRRLAWGNFGQSRPTPA